MGSKSVLERLHNNFLINVIWTAFNLCSVIVFSIVAYASDYSVFWIPVGCFAFAMCLSLIWTFYWDIQIKEEEERLVESDKFFDGLYDIAGVERPNER